MALSFEDLSVPDVTNPPNVHMQFKHSQSTGAVLGVVVTVADSNTGASQTASLSVDDIHTLINKLGTLSF